MKVIKENGKMVILDIGNNHSLTVDFENIQDVKTKIKELNAQDPLIPTDLFVLLRKYAYLFSQYDTEKCFTKEDEECLKKILFMFTLQVGSRIYKNDENRSVYPNDIQKGYNPLNPLFSLDRDGINKSIISNKEEKALKIKELFPGGYYTDRQSNAIDSLLENKCIFFDKIYSK